MLTWLDFVLALLKLCNLIMGRVQTLSERQAGKDEEIARESAEILRKTRFGQQALAEFSNNPGSSDDFLRKLEPNS